VKTDVGSWLLLHEGAVTVCDERGRCRDLDEAGKLIRITTAGDVEEPAHWNKVEKSGLPPLDTSFPFVAKPPKIDPEPVFTPEDLIKLGALGPVIVPPRKVKDDPPPRRTKKPKTEQADEKPSKKRKTEQAEDKPSKKKPVKVAVPRSRRSRSRRSGRAMTMQRPRLRLGSRLVWGSGLVSARSAVAAKAAEAGCRGPGRGTSQTERRAR
jgi:hypothetical protein